MVSFKSFLVATAAFSSVVHSYAIEKRSSPLTVAVSSVGNGVVKVQMTNTGASDLSLYKYGTIMEQGPTQKLTVLKNGALVQHEGILRRYLTTDLTEDAFTTLAAGKTIEQTVNLASVADLSTGGDYDVFAAGAIPLATPGTITLSGESVTYDSNLLTIQVDGAVAARVEKAVKPLDKRTLEESCSSSANNAALQKALRQSVTLANNAATAATSGSASKFNEYFKTTSSSVRSTVAARFRGIAKQAGSTTGGGTFYYCTDVYGDCGSNVLAYTLPSQNTIANCPLYYSGLPSLTGSCHAQDQTTTSMHEFTHAPATYSPGTADNAYGYAASTALSSARAVLNADTYALYANAIYVGC